MQPLVSMAALERSLSRERLAAYRLPGDRDECDGLARYVWNLALAGALLPSMHALEIAFRNEVNRAATRLTANRAYRHDRVASWLDARPSMLLPHEADKVERAKAQLGADPRSQTEGHLIAKLDFGFWVALCREPYADSRAVGPRLWPRALELAFRHRPPGVTTRAQIFHQFDRIRKFRNRVAHHEPIWDRGYVAEHAHVLESLAWMSPKLAEALRHTSPAPATFDAGPAAFRAHAERIVGKGTDVLAIPELSIRPVAADRAKQVR